MKKMTIAGAATADANDFPPEPNEDFARIGDMAKEHGVTLRALRFYEDKGLLRPRREGATRLYTRRDKSRLKLIMLGCRLGFTLRDVKQIMDLYDPHNANAKQVRLILEKSEKQLTRLQKQRLALEESIEELRDLIARMRELGQSVPRSASR